MENFNQMSCGVSPLISLTCDMFHDVIYMIYYMYNMYIYIYIY